MKLVIKDAGRAKGAGRAKVSPKVIRLGRKR